MIAAGLIAVGQLAGRAAAGEGTRGTISVTLDPQAHASGADPIFIDAVEHALVDADFLVLPGAVHSLYVAEVSVTHRFRRLVAAPASVAPAELGTALVVRFPTHKTQLHGLAVTELRVRIVLGDGARPIWQGTAVTDGVEGTPADDPIAVARKLAETLIRRFPAPADRPIAVP